MAILMTLIELTAVIFVIWGYFNEDKFIAFERGIAEKVIRSIYEKD